MRSRLDGIGRSKQRLWAGDERAAVKLAEQLEEEVTDAAPDLGRTLYADLMYAALSEVNWLEIAERMLERRFQAIARGGCLV